MWPFQKKELLGLKLQSKPPAPIGQVRTSFAERIEGPVAFEGRYPLMDVQSHYLCKSCGVPYDEWAEARAVAMLKKSLLDPNAYISMLAIGCRKCSRTSIFSPREVVTRRAGDPFGPWSAEEIEIAEKNIVTMFQLSIKDIASIEKQHFYEVFFLYG